MNQNNNSSIHVLSLRNLVSFSILSFVIKVNVIFYLIKNLFNNLINFLKDVLIFK